MKRIYTALAGLVLACCVLAATDVGDRFPDFQLKDLKGRTVTWSQFEGKLVVVNVWMTMCPACRREMPTLQNLQNKYADRGVVVVGISTDEKANNAAKFVEKLEIKYMLLSDPALTTSAAEQNKFGLVAYPTTFFVDRAGIIRKKVIGFRSEEELEATFSDFLQHYGGSQ